jgi:flagellar biosynthetic protein FliQ
MSETVVVEIARQTIEVTLLVAMPMLVVSLVVGLAVSLFQVATSLQDVTLTFVPKILAVGLTLLFAAHWMLGILLGFTRDLFSDFGRFVG